MKTMENEEHLFLKGNQSRGSLYSRSSERLLHDHKVIQLLKLEKNSREENAAEKKRLAIHPLFLRFRDAEVEKQFVEHFYWLNKKVNRLLISSLFGCLASFFIIFSDIAEINYDDLLLIDFNANFEIILNQILSQGQTELLIHTLSSIIIVIGEVILLSILIIFLMYGNLKKNIFLFEYCYGFLISFLIMKSIWRYQTAQFSTSLIVILEFALGVFSKYRFYITIWSYLFQFIIFFVVTLCVNVFFNGELKNVKPLTYFPIIIFCTNFFFVIFFEYILEKKIRINFRNILKLVKKRNDIQKVSKEVKGILFEILPPMFIDKIINGKLDKKKFMIEVIDNGSCGYADLVAFTKYSEKIESLELIKILNCVFTHFDFLSLRLGLEKISTVGDAFITIGYKGGYERNVKQNILLGFGMIKVLKSLCKDNNWGEITIRIGIACGRLLLVCLGSVKNGINFDLHGETIKNAQILQQKGRNSSVVVEEKVKEMMFIHDINEEEDSFKGRGDNFFKFGKLERNYYMLENDFIRQNKLREYINEVVDNCLSSGRIEMKYLKKEYLESNLTPEKKLKSKTDLVEMKNGIFQKLLKAMRNAFSIYPRAGKIGGEFSYSSLLLLFVKCSKQHEYEKMKRKITITETLMFFIFQPIYTVVFLLYFLSVEKYSFFYDNPFAFGLYLTLFVQIVSILLFPLSIRYYILHHIVSFVNILFSTICNLVFIVFFPFNKEEILTDYENNSALEELFQISLLLLLCISSITPILKFPFFFLHLIFVFLFRFYNFFDDMEYTFLFIWGVIVLDIMAVAGVVMIEYFDATNFIEKKTIEKKEKELKKEHSKIKSLILSILPLHIVELLEKFNEEEDSSKEDFSDKEPDVIDLMENVPVDHVTLGDKTFENLKVFVFFVEIKNFEVFLKRNINSSIFVLSRIFNKFDEVVKKQKGIKIKSLENVYLFISKSIIEGGRIVKEFIHNAKLEINQQKKTGCILEEDGINGIYIGMEYGSISSGVIASFKYRFDIIGSVVNCSSRLCSACKLFEGIENTIHIQAKTLKHLKIINHKIKKRETVELKGIGSCDTCFVEIL